MIPPYLSIYWLCRIGRRDIFCYYGLQ